MAFKVFTILLLLSAAISSTLAAYTYGHNGRPGCKLEEELGRPWRNNFDPTRYWICVELEQPAKEILCPGGTAYYDPASRCVNWEEWEWTEPYDPPTLG